MMHCKRTHLSLVMNAICAGDIATNVFCAGDKPISRYKRTRWGTRVRVRTSATPTNNELLRGLLRGLENLRGSQMKSLLQFMQYFPSLTFLLCWEVQWFGQLVFCLFSYRNFPTVVCASHFLLCSIASSHSLWVWVWLRYEREFPNGTSVRGTFVRERSRGEPS